MHDVDQRRFNNPSQPRASRLMTGREAADYLGVKAPTLYAYASRGLVRSIPWGPGKARRYLVEDIHRLKARSDSRRGHGAVAAAALIWGEPVLTTAISAISDGGPSYRGHAALDLAGSHRFEDVVELLWHGALPSAMSRVEPDGRTARRPERASPRRPRSPQPPILERMMGRVLDAARRDDARHVKTETADAARGRRLLEAFAGCVTGRPRRARNHRPIAETLAADFGFAATGAKARALDQALVLIADHELNPSTFTARITASSGADLYACVLAALCTLSGPKHGGECDRVEALIEEIGTPARAKATALARLRRGERISGFQHRLYPAGDPRAQRLLQLAEQLAERDPPAELRILQALTRALARPAYGHPTVDLGLVALTSALRLPRGTAIGLFALGRCAGWIAHVFEQRTTGQLLRPRARYVGPPVQAGR